MKNNLLGPLVAGSLVLSVMIAPLASASQLPSPSDYLVFPQVNPGNKLVISFSFDPALNLVNATGANTVIFDVGGYGTALSAGLALYAGSNLLGRVDSGSPAAAGMFISDQLGYSSGYFWSKSVDAVALDSILNGAVSATLEVTPIGGFMAWGGWGPHAGILSGTLTYQDIFPIANVTAVSVVAVPEPPTYLLLLGCLVLMGLMTTGSVKPPST